MIKEITRFIKEGKDNDDYWISNSTFNDLSKKMKEMRLTDAGIMELCFEEGVTLGVDLGTILCPFEPEEKACFVLVMYLRIEDDGCVYEWGKGSKNYQIL